MDSGLGESTKMMYRFTSVIGRNNRIAKSAIIHDGAIIGDNNFIGENVVIYPGVIIGSGNQIYPRSVIGEMPVSSDNRFWDYCPDRQKGVNIGNQNLLHVSSLIFSGIDRETRIGDRNRLLASTHMGHDAVIGDGVTIYPNVVLGGYSSCLNGASVGMGAFIQQRRVVGQAAMVGGGYLMSKHTFPFFVHIAGRMTRINGVKIDPVIKLYESVLKEIADAPVLLREALYDQLPPYLRNELVRYYDECTRIGGATK